MFTTLITYILYFTAFFLPLVFTTFNYELFEFPKFILLIASTLPIAILTLADHILNAKNPLQQLWFQATKQQKLLHTSVLAVLATQALATFFSVHPTTSFWGYYGRFHQGLLTTICYSILYFASVLYLNKKSTQNIIKISITTSIIVGLYAIAQHFGIDKNIWVQDVQNRVFSTLGQPNWLAAYLIPNMFLIGYSYYIKIHQGKNQPLFHLALFLVLFISLLYTKSRSGLLAFVASYLIYYALMLRNFGLAKLSKPQILNSLPIILFVLIIGTPWSPSLATFFSRKLPPPIIPIGAALETGGLALRSLGEGGTESGEIRKIVWSGALELIKLYPLLGTGPETFAYTYYQVRPLTHNYVSEWDFLYNKAHNEYLNIAATTGLIGLIGYLLFHLSIAIYSWQKPSKPKKKVGNDEYIYLRNYYPVLGSSLASFFITNFFGFSVIPVYFALVILAAMATTINTPTTNDKAQNHKYLLPILLAFASIYIPIRLFWADYLYTQGKAQKNIESIKQAISLAPHADLYLTTLSELYASHSLESQAISTTQLLLQQNMIHQNNLKSAAKTYLTLASNDNSYYHQAALVLESAAHLAPTDPKLLYNLGLIYSRLGDSEKSIAAMRKAIEFKTNYPEPYYALTLLLEEAKRTDEIKPLLQDAQKNLATYSAELGNKITKYVAD